MLTFWDTVRGTHLADTLIRELPKLSEKRRQQITPLNTEREVEALHESIRRGEKAVVTSFSVDGTTYVVTESGVTR